MFKEMEYVYAVHKEKSFSKAAKKLYISQPALSATIKKVEAKIKVPIFDRSTKPIQLTKAGHYYIESIEKIMNILEDMNSHFKTMACNGTKEINIGSSAFFCAHVLPYIIYKFTLLHPEYKITLLEKNATELVENIQSGAIDIGITVDTLDEELYTTTLWKDETIILAVPSSYEINSKLESLQLSYNEIQNKKHLDKNCPSVNLSLFKDYPFLFLQEGNDLYTRGSEMCKNAGFRPQIKMILDQMLTSYYVALSGNGIVFVRDDITQYVESTKKLVFYRINDDKSTRFIKITYNKKSHLVADIMTIIDYIKEN